jgi:hypothetical protein
LIARAKSPVTISPCHFINEMGKSVLPRRFAPGMISAGIGIARGLGACRPTRVG